ncbi:hypothetical protein COU75_01550 [Candidatus Peregrinibacteria bacterium CG10_big_fil_rev_8_21_14_0_10_42_8]|nr:MAG: hypothetical protein COU75_01550 [Candidatus Peregrinibacteria bacterium CG10_big_fil_rev_8_21_14_0_10_42_8]
MPNLHPHWESDGTEIPVHTREEKQDSHTMPRNAKAVSRQPAAIVGMITVMAFGYLFFQGVESLTGQVAGNSRIKTVTITENGLDPAILEIEHGDTITWTNTQAIPHIIESTSLCSDTGYCLQTKTLFQGESDNFTITLDIPAGSYDYTSATSSDIQGTIIITTTPADDFQDITSLLDNSIFGNTPIDNAPLQPNAPIPTAVPEAAGITNTSIPRNPYTADSTRIHPFDSKGNPIESAFGDIPNTQTASVPRVNTNGRGPISQPQTGAGGTLFILLGSIIVLWIVTKQCFEKTYHF